MSPSPTALIEPSGASAAPLSPTQNFSTKAARCPKRSVNSTTTEGGWRIWKLGGTTVADARAVEHLVTALKAHQGPAAVVVSALDGVTDALIGATSACREGASNFVAELRLRHIGYLTELIGQPAPATISAIESLLDSLHRELQQPSQGALSPASKAFVMATGERLSTLIIQAVLEHAGHWAESVDATELLYARGSVLDADPDLDTSRMLVSRQLQDRACRTWVVPGFFARGDSGELHLLGRGGSDTSATLLAAALSRAGEKSRRVEIWTDVEGIYPRDPRQHPGDLPYHRLSYDHAEELARNGAQVLHAKSLAPARSAGITLRVCGGRRPDDTGTMVWSGGAKAACHLDSYGQDQWALGALEMLCAVDSSTGQEGRLLEPLSVLLDPLVYNYGGRRIDQTVARPEGMAANVLAVWGRPRLLLTTHLDTVPPFFAPRRDANGLLARGSCDAKGQIVAQLMVLHRLLAAGVRNIAWLGVVGEETSSDGARAALDLAQHLPELQAIVNGEPTENCLATVQPGYMHLRLRCRGRRAHSSDSHAAHPVTGTSALWPLLSWLSALGEVPLRGQPQLGTESWNLGTMAGGEAANVVAGDARAEISARTLPSSRFMDHVRALAPEGAECEIEIVVDEPPIELYTVDSVPSKAVSFGSDLATLRHLVPSHGRLLMLGPGSINLAHTDHEYLGWNELSKGVDQLEVVCRHLLAQGATP